MKKRVLVISDNEVIFERFRNMVAEGLFEPHEFQFAFSSKNAALVAKYVGSSEFKPIHVKRDADTIASDHDLVISMHCKQLFPVGLIGRVRCINVHPGLNPFNRGWFPQVFSILNGLPCGATIHEIDEQLDHGPIIVQQPVELFPWDNSLSIYNRVIDAEVELLRLHLKDIIDGNYVAKPAERDGNLNLKKDFDRLCELDLSDTDTLAKHLDRLRALTHGNYMNAFYRLPDGRKVYVKVEMTVGE